MDMMKKQKKESLDNSYNNNTNGRSTPGVQKRGSGSHIRVVQNLGSESESANNNADQNEEAEEDEDNIITSSSSNSHDGDGDGGNRRHGCIRQWTAM